MSRLPQVVKWQDASVLFEQTSPGLGLKPWQLPPGGIAAWKDNAQLGCAYEYLRRASSLTPSEQVAAQGASTCVRRLRDYQRALERDPRFANEVWPKSIARSCPGYPSFPLF